MTIVDPAGEARMTDQTTLETTTQPTPTVEGSGRTVLRSECCGVALLYCERDDDNVCQVCKTHYRRGERVPAPSPTAARGVTGLPSAGDVQEALSWWADCYRSAITAEFNAGEDYAETDPDVDRAYEASRKASDAVLALVTTLLSAAEQGKRDREDAERWRYARDHVLPVMLVARAGGMHLLVEAPRWREDGEKLLSCESPGGPTTELVTRAIDAARQPRQEGGR